MSELSLTASSKPKNCARTVGDVIGEVTGQPVTAKIDGILRGLIRPGTEVSDGLKIGDIDPRGNTDYCYTISDKARALSGSVLEGVMRFHNQPGG